MCIHDISELKNGHLVAKEFLHVGPFPQPFIRLVIRTTRIFTSRS